MDAPLPFNVNDQRYYVLHTASIPFDSCKSNTYSINMKICPTSSNALTSIHIRIFE